MNNKITIDRLDTGEILDTQEDTNEYLERTFESNDPKQVTKAPRNTAHAQDMSIDLNIRIDPEIKQSAEHLFKSFGITVSDAVNIFLHKSLMVGGLPFEMRQPHYKAEIEAAIKETELNDAMGIFNKYANLDLIPLEKEAWEMVVKEKHAR